MQRSKARRGWQNLIASAVFATLCIVPVVHGSFFYNNLIPPPTGTNPNKEIDPPVKECLPPPPCTKTCTPPPPVNHAPEPATIVLAMLGVAGAGAYRRISKKS